MADYKKPDYWQQKARKEGYPARSVYKLMEIDQKFGIFKTPRLLSERPAAGGLRVLDLGAAPGSWSLYVLRILQRSSPRILQRSFPCKTAGNVFLAAVDLSPLSREYDKGLFDGDNFFFIQGDITAAPTREALLAKGPYSTIISDAAPSTTGNHTVDAVRSLELAEAVVGYAESALAPGGSLALKVFQGGDSAALLKRMKTLFETAKSFKPLACRGESVETYFVGVGKK